MSLEESMICSHSSTNPESVVKIGLVDFEIIGLPEICLKTNIKQGSHKPQTLPPVLPSGELL